VSYNCRGLTGNKRSFVKSLLVNYNVAFLQEHRLTDGQLHCIGDIDDKFVYIGVSGFDSSDILDGRWHGRCAILWRSVLYANVEDIDTNSRRICANRLVSGCLKL